MSSANKDHSLVEQANYSAKEMALYWIRSVFRQVSVQTLKQLWTITHGDDNDSTKLHITHEHLETCERTCERLGNFWCQRLRDSGQMQVAEWVNEIMDKRRFWESDDVLLGKASLTSGEGETAATLQTSSENKSIGACSKPEVEPLPLPPNGSKLILTKIRRLGERKVGEAPPSLDRVSRTLDELGRNGETEWPLDWSIIEEAARNNVKRLHSESIRGRPLHKASKNNYEVVPKSLVETTENQQEIDAIMASRGRLTMMVERKRKAAAEPSADETTQVAPPTLKSLARAPSSFGDNERLSWNDDVIATLSEQDRQQLERDMIHKNQEAEEPPAELHSVLGALKDVGGYHMYLQNQHDDTIEEMSDKKRRREERKARKQRLFPRQVEKQDRETKKAVTKVMRTLDSAEQHWMELDMGECLVEIVDPESSQKKLCALSSLEVLLKDEDATTDETVEEPQPNS